VPEGLFKKLPKFGKIRDVVVVCICSLFDDGYKFGKAVGGILGSIAATPYFERRE